MGFIFHSLPVLPSSAVISSTSKDLTPRVQYQNYSKLSPINFEGITFNDIHWPPYFVTKLAPIRKKLGTNVVEKSSKFFPPGGVPIWGLTVYEGRWNRSNQTKFFYLGGVSVEAKKIKVLQKNSIFGEKLFLRCIFKRHLATKLYHSTQVALDFFSPEKM